MWKIDDYQFGGGAGMVLMVEPIDKCISKLKSERNYDEIIYMTPDAATLNQQTANKISLKNRIERARRNIPVVGKLPFGRTLSLTALMRPPMIALIGPLSSGHFRASEGVNY